ncbi:MAG: hypothetical protein QF371_03845 [Flavobacteriales bacterium]|nr:hypothetical protein [Flavobacteriales bacterium]
MDYRQLVKDEIEGQLEVRLREGVKLRTKLPETLEEMGLEVTYYKTDVNVNVA